jgi:hypothetical protein
MELFYDVYESSLKKTGEELSGDKVKVLKEAGKTLIVLSDGLGSGVKANILATLTTEIVMTMLHNDIPLEEIIRTILGTLPICQVRKLAYSTFTILTIDERNRTFRIMNVDNPPFFHIRNGKILRHETQTATILGKQVTSYEGPAEKGDFLGIMSDGVLYAGLGDTLNYGWGWENISVFLEETFKKQVGCASEAVHAVMNQTQRLYGGKLGDDATFVGMLVRESATLHIFTGPPVDRNSQEFHIRQFLSAEGRKVICGGTTANLIAKILGRKVETRTDGNLGDVPPPGALKGIDLVTEGIITLSRALEFIKKDAPRPDREKPGTNAAILLAAEMMQADHIRFIVGQSINPYYQNPLLPKNVSIRTNLVGMIAEALRSYGKSVEVVLC